MGALGGCRNAEAEAVVRQQDLSGGGVGRVGGAVVVGAGVEEGRAWDSGGGQDRGGWRWGRCAQEVQALVDTCKVQMEVRTLFRGVVPHKMKGNHQSR